MKIENLTFMYGEDSFSLQKEVDRWKKGFIEKHGDLNLLEIANGEIEVAELRSNISSLPFLGEKRLIILKDCLKKAELKEALADIPSSTVVLIAETNPPDKRTSLFKHLSVVATVRLFLPPKGAQLRTWVERRTEFHEGHIDGNAAAYLINICGENLWNLDNEIQKLCLYARGESISIEKIEELVSGNIQESIFKMIDELSQKRVAEVLRLLRQLQEQGEDAGFVFSMIARQFRLMLEVKALLEERYNPNMLASRVGIAPFVANIVSRQCRNFTYGELRKVMSGLLKIDRRLKTGLLELSAKNQDHYLLEIERLFVA